jgi:hypothetical protein
MKLKILITPALIVASIILMIWFVYPAYTNSSDGSGIKEKLGKLKVEEEKISQIDQKMENAKSLSADISKNQEKGIVLFNFISESIKEEEIISALDRLVSSSGLAVTTISVSSPKNEPNAVTETIQTPETTMNSAISGGSGSAGNVPVPIPKPTPRAFEARVTAIGDYLKVKELADRINRLKRYNEFVSIEIKPAELAISSGSGNSSVVNPNILQMDATIGFNFLKKSSAPANIDDPIFSVGSFDMSIIDKIQAEKNIEKVNIEVGQTGKNSPFIP